MTNRTANQRFAAPELPRDARAVEIPECDWRRNEKTMSVQRRHLLTITGRRLIALCAVSLAVSVLFVLSGCATTRSLTPEDKSQLGRIGIAKAYEKPIVEFAGVPNAATGAALGVIGGLLFPPAWYVGGPFFFGPLSATNSARCGAQFNYVKDPGQQFDAAVNATRPDELLLKYLADRIEGAGLGSTSVLESPLKRLDEGKFNATAISDQSIDTVLQIEQFKVGLAASYSSNQSGITSSCFPKVTVDIVWHLIRVKDGKQIATGSDNWSVTSARGFPAFFRDAPHMQSILKELLERVASGTICTTGAVSSQCLGARHGPATVTPPPVEPVHGNPQRVPAQVSNDDYLNCVTRGVGKCDDLVNCVANGERQWTNRSKCD